MFCDEALDAVEAIAAGEVTADGRIADHLASCPNCAAALVAARQLERGLPPRRAVAAALRRRRRAARERARRLVVGGTRRHPVMRSAECGLRIDWRLRI